MQLAFPRGWNIPRGKVTVLRQETVLALSFLLPLLLEGTVYRNVTNTLIREGCLQEQKSVYIKDDTTAGMALVIGVGLLQQVQPVGLFASVVSEFAISLVPSSLILNDEMRLGGLLSCRTLRPTPLELVPEHVPGVGDRIPCVVLPNPFPRHVPEEGNTLVPGNWAELICESFVAPTTQLS